MKRSLSVAAFLACSATLLAAGCGKETAPTPTPVDPVTATPVTTTPHPTASRGNDGPGADTWTTLPAMPGGARQETGVVSVGGEVWVLGGIDAAGGTVARVEIYDPRKGEWRRGPELPMPVHHANVAALDGTVYVAGFLTGRSFAADGTVFALRPSGTWERRRSMPEGTHRGASGVTVADGKLYVAGGFRGSAVDDFSAYDPVVDRWSRLPDLPVATDHLVAGTIDGIVYAAGGRGGDIRLHRPRVDAYDPATMRWSTRAPMPTSRAGAAGAVLDGRLYVFGGEGNRAEATGVFPETESYDPDEDRWSTHAPMRVPRHGTGAAAVGPTIYVPGGADVEGFGAVAVAEAFTPDTVATGRAGPSGPQLGLALPFRVADVRGEDGFVSPFGLIRHSRDRGHGHGGIDIPLESDAPIFAVDAGMIVSSEESSDAAGGFDIKLVISGSGDEGWGFLYEHVTLRPEIRVGGEVTKGQHIANNGLATDRRNNHFQLTYMFNNYMFYRDHRCWPDYLDAASGTALLELFESLKTRGALRAAWETATEEGAMAYRALLDAEKFPDGAQLCYPLGLDVRVPE